MRWILPLLLCTLPVYVGCSSSKTQAPAARVGSKLADAQMDPNLEGMKKEAGEPVAFNEQDQLKPDKQEDKKAKAAQPRKIRYTADMKLVVEKIEVAEEALDAARKEAKGDYEKAEVNRSSNTVRSGMWRVRVPVENLHSFRKSVAQIGEVERDTLESEDITAKYYDLDAHITNRKLDREALREFLTEIGKKDPRYLEVKRELDTVSDYINRQEGQLKLWKDLTDLTTFTVHMREKQPYTPVVVQDKESPPTFDTRASTTWNASWDSFVGFCQWVLLVIIAATPWLPIPLVFFTGVWLVARKVARRSNSEPEALAKKA